MTQSSKEPGVGSEAARHRRGLGLRAWGMLALLALFTSLACRENPRDHYRYDLARADQFIRKVEAFKQEYHRLPTLDDTTELQRGNLDYRVVENGYVVGFRDGSRVVHSWDSRTGRWDFEE